MTWHSLPMGRVLCVMPQGKLIQIERPQERKETKRQMGNFNPQWPRNPCGWKHLEHDPRHLHPAHPSLGLEWLSHLQVRGTSRHPPSQSSMPSSPPRSPASGPPLKLFLQPGINSTPPPPTPALKSCLVPRPTQLKHHALGPSNHLLTQPLPHSSPCP